VTVALPVIVVSAVSLAVIVWALGVIQGRFAQAGVRECCFALTSGPGISHLYQSGPRMKGTKSDWLVYNLNLLQVVLGQGFHPRSRSGLIFRQAVERRPAR
jgi:hypothetical protein